MLAPGSNRPARMWLGVATTVVALAGVISAAVQGNWIMVTLMALAGVAGAGQAIQELLKRR